MKKIHHHNARMAAQHTYGNGAELVTHGLATMHTALLMLIRESEGNPQAREHYRMLLARVLQLHANMAELPDLTPPKTPPPVDILAMLARE